MSQARRASHRPSPGQVSRPGTAALNHPSSPADLASYIPSEIGRIANHQTDLPRIARDGKLMPLIEATLRQVPSNHTLYRADARDLSFLRAESVHLVVTSPPYWTLKEYRRNPGQLGAVSEYETFLVELDRVWAHCFRLLVPGGRLVCVVGDVCLSRRKNEGRHTVVPLHASIQEHCRRIGFDNLAPIIWHKIANAVHEVENGSGFLGKPYEPNAVIKNDIEFILMQRKPGGYRSPSVSTRVLSLISAERIIRDGSSKFGAVLRVLPQDTTRHHFRSIWHRGSYACLASWATPCSIHSWVPARRMWPHRDGPDTASE